MLVMLLCACFWRPQADRLPRLPGGPELRNSLPLWLVLSPPGASPDKRRLMTVQDFFSYAEDEGVEDTACCLQPANCIYTLVEVLSIRFPHC
jgi:hypothetical protein